MDKLLESLRRRILEMEDDGLEDTQEYEKLSDDYQALALDRVVENILEDILGDTD